MERLSAEKTGLIDTHKLKRIEIRYLMTENFDLGLRIIGQSIGDRLNNFKNFRQLLIRLDLYLEVNVKYTW